jgi:hypothetical protein
MRRGFQGWSRRFYTSNLDQGSIERTITKKFVEKDGGSVIEKKSFLQTFSRMSRGKKIFLGVYGILATGGFAMSVHNDGREELLKHRSRTKKDMFDSDWDAVKYGCERDLGFNFFRSLFFPYTILSDMMPHIVLATTKNSPESKQDKE